MQNIPGLRSCYDKVGRLIYFGRMLDKIRLHAAGQLPPDYVENLGEHQFTLDGRCCRFLGVPYSQIKKRTLAGEPDEAVLNWAHAHGTPRTTKSATSGTASSPSSAGATNAATSCRSASKRAA